MTALVTIMVSVPRSAKNWKHAAQFPMTDQRLTSDERHLDGIVTLHQAENSVDQIVAAKI